jgi:DNA-binding MarR family transcriptional regulator
MTDSATPSDGHEAARLRSAIRALVRRFSVSERADVECCGLTVAQAATLEALQATPGMRLSDLGKRLGITPSTLTRNLARLEREGLVCRIPDPGDGRAFQVALTATGDRAAEGVGKQGVDFAAEVLARLPHGDRTAAVSALERLLEAVREATEDCCPGAFVHLMKGFARDEARAGRSDDGNEGGCAC